MLAINKPDPSSIITLLEVVYSVWRARVARSWSHGERRLNQQPNPKRYQKWRDGLQCGHKVR